ncbi:MAG: hypothetical protein P8O95_06565 [Flavobacteriaceae bacterium]|nr:hypothetical protein [Flavobacteriaceae bacterium]
MLKKLLLLIALSSNVLFGQEIEFKLSDQELTTLDRGRGLLLQFSGDSLTTIDVAVFEIKSKKALKLPTNFTFIEYRPIWLNNTLLLSEKDGGKVYAIEKDSLVRRDRSDIRHWQSDSSLFHRNDTIYKYGGYGYWTTSNALTYLDPISKGWEVIGTKGLEVPKSTHSQIHFLNKNNLFILGGYHLSGINRLKALYQNSVWAYDFKLKIWSYLGQSIIEEMDQYMRIDTGPEGTHELFSEQRSLIKIDLINNKTSYYTENPLYFDVEMDLNLPIYKYKNAYIYYQKTDKNLLLTKVTENLFVQQKSENSSLFVQQKNRTLYAVFSVLFGVLIIVLWLILKKKKTLFVFEHKISFNKKEAFLEPTEYLILKTLIVNTALESAQILSLIYNESLTKSHNEKIKNNLIESLNLKLSYVIGGGAAPIASEKSPEDKRIRTYSLKIPQVKVRLEK